MVISYPLILIRLIPTNALDESYYFFLKEQFKAYTKRFNLFK